MIEMAACPCRLPKVQSSGCVNLVPPLLLLLLPLFLVSSHMSRPAQLIYCNVLARLVDTPVTGLTDVQRN